MRYKATFQAGEIEHIKTKMQTTKELLEDGKIILAHRELEGGLQVLRGLKLRFTAPPRRKR